MNESLQIRKAGNMISTSVLSRIDPVDFVDTFCCRITAERDIRPADVLISMFTNYPQWVEALMKLRNCLVEPFGLKGGKGPEVAEYHKIISDFAIAHPDMTREEAVFTADDKHLQFYVSAIVRPMEANVKEVTVSTLVQFHNNWGRTYFFFIRPFHSIIVPATLKRALKRMVIN